MKYLNTTTAVNVRGDMQEVNHIEVADANINSVSLLTDPSVEH